MSHHIEKHPTLPIIMRRYDDTLDVAEVQPTLQSEDSDLIAVQQGKVYYLLDIRDLHLGLDELSMAGSMASRKGSNLNNPNVIETLVVVPNRLMEIATQGLRTATFGQMKVRAFRTLEAAFAYVEQQVASQLK
jgi:hypothetical protein